MLIIMVDHVLDPSIMSMFVTILLRKTDLLFEAGHVVPHYLWLLVKEIHMTGSLLFTTSSIDAFFFKPLDRNVSSHVGPSLVVLQFSLALVSFL